MPCLKSYRLDERSRMAHPARHLRRWRRSWHTGRRTHYTMADTCSRAWLRELQVNANREFYGAARDIVTYVVTGHADEPLIDPNPPPRGAPDAIAKRATNLTEKHLAMLPVCEQRTADMATVVVNTLPCLAYQAVPLPTCGWPPGFH